MRHAPEQFVQMGNADWFDDHGFEQRETPPAARFQLDRAGEPRQAAFEFLEPVVVELKLSNVSGEPQRDRAGRCCSITSAMTVIVKRKDRPAQRQYLPFARTTAWSPSSARCSARAQPVYESLFIGAGPNGWLICRAGQLHRPGRRCTSTTRTSCPTPLQFRVAPPRSYDEAAPGPGLLQRPVGRVLAFDGSSVLDDGQRHAARGRRSARRRAPAAIHARFALGNPLATASSGSSPRTPPRATARRRCRSRRRADEGRPQAGRERAKSDMQAAARTFGHIGFRRRVERFADALPPPRPRRWASRWWPRCARAAVPDRLLDPAAGGKRRNVGEPPGRSPTDPADPAALPF